MQNELNRRLFLKWANLLGVAAAFPAAAKSGAVPTQDAKLAHPASAAQAKEPPSPDTILLKDYRPKSIYKIPITQIDKAKFPIIDMHSHPYAKTPQQIEEWIKNMDEVGVQKTMILTMTTGAEFGEIYQKYSKYPDRFAVWCGLDFSNYNNPGFGAAAVKELERCHKMGARGVGEIHDKGEGLRSGKSAAPGMHPDDARMDAIWDKCAELGMPVSLHVADPIWMYQKMDNTNDGLMNAYKWRLDNKPNIVNLPGMVEIFDRTLAKHRKTTFIACHFMNLDYDLARLGEMFDRNPNLYADISARYAETGPIPRFAAKFYEKYAGRLVYGTDMGFEKPMYRVTFRILESQDEHFYEREQFGYHWALNGFGLSDDVLRQVYQDTATKLLAARSDHGG
ncbi:MAG TPA: amidohydrolase family protein [Candidatus Sulfotelmatobacter sp.]|nr:amidohydrolase family protein [Candidatus Sulfotelmatobacter sp.]